MTSHAEAALERNALNEPIRFVQLEFDDILKQLTGDMIDIKISSIYKFEKKKTKKKQNKKNKKKKKKQKKKKKKKKTQPIYQGLYVLKDEPL